MTPTSPASLALTFAEFAHDAFRNGLPERVRLVAARQLLDSIGVSLAAIGEETVVGVERLVSSWRSQGKSRYLGSTIRLPASHAALVAGTLAHALDFDDTHFPSVLHPSATVVPATMAVADEVDASLGQSTDAIALGNELVVRLGMAGYDEKLGNSIFFERGFHATSICGAVGAALASGLLRGSTPRALADAMGIASSFGSGLLEANRAGGTVKRMHCGWAAHAGIVASELTAHGVTGPSTIFEGRFGFLEAFCGKEARPERVLHDLGSFAELASVGFKPYPTNGFTHSVIDAGLELKRQGVEANDVVKATISLPAPVLRTVAEPRGEKIRPATPYGARFSAPFVFALSLASQRELGIVMDDFSASSISDPALLRLAGATFVEATQDLTAAFPASVPARVNVDLADGTNRRVEIPHALGSAGRPMPDDLLQTKFLSCAGRVLEPRVAEELMVFVTQPMWGHPAGRLLDIATNRSAQAPTAQKPAQT